LAPGKGSRSCRSTRRRETPHVISVSMDNIAGCGAVMDHLLCMVRDVAVIRGPRRDYDADQRWLGCQQAPSGPASR